MTEMCHSVAARRSLPKIRKIPTPTRKKLLSSVKLNPERSVRSIKKFFETGLRCEKPKISCRNEDDRSNLEKRKLLENTEAVIDVVTELEAEDVIDEMKKTPTVRKLEEAGMKMKKLEKKNEVEKLKMKTGNLCKVKMVDESPPPEGNIQRKVSKLTPKLFSIFEKQKLKFGNVEMGFLESCDITVTLPYVDNTSCAQDCKAGTQLGRQQPMEGLDTLGKGDCTECEQNGELGLASREWSQGYLTNKRGLKKNLGAEKSRENLGAEQ